MCGINGVIGERDQEQAGRWVDAMNAAMPHRGPDAEGRWIAPSVAFGHRRLSIIDTSEAGTQPFFSHDRKLVLVFNGEVYNYLELRNELSSRHEFRTATDTEVILTAYREWGIDAIHRFVGMFAFALWDAEAQRGYIVRDRLGIKPVYTAAVNGNLFFASEIRSLLATGEIVRRIDRSALADYLRYQTVHAPSTIVEGVSMLEAGHYLEFGDGVEKRVKYWDAASQAAQHHPGSPDEIHQEIARLLHSSVELRMRADVPFGAFLSGGIDSSIVVGLMAGVSTQPVNTFSVTFDEKQWDESPYSSMIARRFNTRHHPIPLRASDFLNELPDALAAMDHPSGDGPNTYVVSGVTRREGVKMALSGLGGDEVFAGYPVFTRMKKLEANRWISKTPRMLRTLSARALSAMKPSVAAEKISAMLAEDELDFVHSYPYSRRVLLDDRIRMLLSYDLPQHNAVLDIARHAASAGLPLLSRVSLAEMNSYMQHVLLRDADQMSMAHSLEVRVPFLDHRLVEYVLSVGDDMKYPHTPKKLLTDSVGDLIPREIIDRPKMGFTFPWALWMKGELRPLCVENLNYLGAMGHFRPGAVDRLWQQFLAGDPAVTWSRVWPLVVLGHWARTHELS
jgi:asparagine synthase (glutamine-hydrolysing)